MELYIFPYEMAISKLYNLYKNYDLIKLINFIQFTNILKWLLCNLNMKANEVILFFLL